MFARTRREGRGTRREAEGDGAWEVLETALGAGVETGAPECGDQLLLGAAADHVRADVSFPVDDEHGRDRRDLVASLDVAVLVEELGEGVAELVDEDFGLRLTLAAVDV